MGPFRRTYRDASGVLRTSRFWYVRDPATGKERSLRVTSERVAQVMWADMLRAHELRLAGVDTHEPTRRARPLDLLDDYLRELGRRNRSERYRSTMRRRVGAFLARVDSIADLTPARIEALLPAIMDAAEEERRVSQPGAERHRPSARTQNHYLAALSTFFGWLVKTKRWAENPASPKVVERAVVAGASRERWSLTKGQLTALVDRTPLHRAIAYLVAATTGLRRSELVQLREADVDLEHGEVRVRARTAKDRTDDTLPLPAWTVEMLRAYLRLVPPDARPKQVGGLKPRGDRLLVTVPTVATLRRDLRRAGIPERNEAGDIFDFHSLRVTFATLLAREGVGLQVVARLMRHSDPRLTQAIYTRLVLHDGHRAVAGLRPEPGHETAVDPADRSRNSMDSMDSVDRSTGTNG